MVVKYVPGGLIELHDHAFEEGFFFLEGEIEAQPRARHTRWSPGTTAGAVSAARTRSPTTPRRRSAGSRRRSRSRRGCIRSASSPTGRHSLRAADGPGRAHSSGSGAADSLSCAASGAAPVDRQRVHPVPGRARGRIRPGPARQAFRLPSARTAAAALALVLAATAVTWTDGLDWTPDRVLLVFLAPALILRRGRRYLLDFVPFALMIMLYAECAAWRTSPPRTRSTVRSCGSSATCSAASLPSGSRSTSGTARCGGTTRSRPGCSTFTSWCRRSSPSHSGCGGAPSSTASRRA